MHNLENLDLSYGSIMQIVTQIVPVGSFDDRSGDDGDGTGQDAPSIKMHVGVVQCKPTDSWTLLLMDGD
jgi:hypothetical protein